MFEGYEQLCLRPFTLANCLAFPFSPTSVAQNKSCFSKVAYNITATGCIITHNTTYSKHRIAFYQNEIQCLKAMKVTKKSPKVAYTISH